MKLWPVGKVIPIRFHDTRHTTASLLMMFGANPRDRPDPRAERLGTRQDGEFESGGYVPIQLRQ